MPYNHLMAIYDRAILEAALVGLAQKKSDIEQMIEQLGGKRFSAVKQVTAKSQPPKKRTMSAEARKRIADAQKKRWAAYHKKKGE